MDTFLQVVANGLLLGALFAIVSVGLTLIFGIVKAVNFAHGEFLMVGMYLTYLLMNRSWHTSVRYRDRRRASPVSVRSVDAAILDLASDGCA